MNKFFAVSAGAALLLALQGTAWAEEPPPPPPGEEGGHHGMMEKADTNHDGKISYDEFKAFHETKMQEHFKKEDLNGDGFIDKEEARKGREMMREKMHERMEKRHERKDPPPPQ